MKLSAINVEKTNKVLETIASEYPKRSKENKALELAAKAMIFANSSGTRRQFGVFLRDFNSELSPEQQRRLREIGIAM